MSSSPSSPRPLVLVPLLYTAELTTPICCGGLLNFLTERVTTLSYLEYFLGIWQKVSFFVVGEKKQAFLRRRDGTVLGLSLG